MSETRNPIWDAWWKARAQRIRDEVSIFDVLAHYGVEYRDRGDGQVRCAHHGEDNRPSAYVYADSNTVFCFQEWKSRDVIFYYWDMEGRETLKFGQMLHRLESEFGLTHFPPPEDLPPPPVESATAADDPTGHTTFVDPEPTKEELQLAVRQEARRVENLITERREALGLDKVTRLFQAVDVTVYGFIRGEVSRDDVTTRFSTLRKKVLALA